MKGLLLAFGLMTGALAQAQEFSIDRFLVRWMVMNVGNTEIRVMKNQDETYINVYKSNGLVSATTRIPGEDAERIAQTLLRTQEFFAAQRGSQDNVAEALQAGNFTVTFRTSVFNGFTVVIQENDRFSTNAVTLTREEALGIQPELARATQYIAFLDSKVAF